MFSDFFGNLEVGEIFWVPAKADSPKVVGKSVCFGIHTTTDMWERPEWPVRRQMRIEGHDQMVFWILNYYQYYAQIFQQL